MTNSETIEMAESYIRQLYKIIETNITEQRGLLGKYCESIHAHYSEICSIHPYLYTGLMIVGQACIYPHTSVCYSIIIWNSVKRMMEGKITPEKFEKMLSYYTEYCSMIDNVLV